MEQFIELAKPVIEAYMGGNGKVLQLLSILGTVRLFIKPLMGLLEAYVKATPSIKDDKLPEKIKSHKIYKLLV